MIVVIEGPDGAGKTTLAKSLLVGPDDTYHHEGPPPANVDLYVHYSQNVMPFEDAAGTHVFDRLMLGELVYGPILRGESRISINDYLRFKHVLHGAAVHILCLPPWEECFKNWYHRHETSGGEHIRNVEAFRRTYTAWTSMRHLADLVVDYTKGSK